MSNPYYEGEEEFWTNPQKMRELLIKMRQADRERAENPPKPPFHDVESYSGHRKLFYEGRKVEGTMLTVVGNRMSERGPEVVCDCDCGKRIGIPYKTLYYHVAYSCGCTKKPTAPIVPRYDFSGRTFGRLTVMEYKGADGWECLCRDCQETEMVVSKPGYTYRAMLERTGGRECPNLERVNAGKNRWRVTVTTWMNDDGKIGAGAGEDNYRIVYAMTSAEAVELVKPDLTKMQTIAETRLLR